MGYGEGARATLACWLKEQAAALFGDGVVGKAILIRWLSDARDHRAWVSGFSSESGRHTVRGKRAEYRWGSFVTSEPVSAGRRRPVLRASEWYGN